MKRINEFLARLGLNDQPIINDGSGSDWTLAQLLKRFAEINKLDELEHYKDTTVGLYATDRPDLVVDEKNVMFQLKY